MKNCPAVLSYVARVGAEACNFRKWQVREFKGQYYYEKAYIIINPDGTVTAPANFLPTDAEAKEIERTWDEAALPKVAPARDTRGIKLQTPGSVLYEFYNDANQLIFVQERCEPKAYIPWTFWSDGEWRMMHPDDKYPFWKPKKRNPNGKIMIHEGCKAAEYANRLPEDHPWYEELCDYEHWGIIGGALAVNRADYPTLRREKVHDIIYVCDNDWPGRSVLQELSRNYAQHLVGVVFDTRFKTGFDIADPMPPSFFEKGKYVGPSFDDFKKPATYATELIVPAKGKAYPVMRKAFLEEWVHCVTPEIFVHKAWPSKIMTKSEFNNFISPYSHTNETSSLVIKDDASKGYLLKYDPSREVGIFVSEEGQCINTHQPSKIKPMDGSPKPFLDFMEHLIPDKKDRYHLLRWIATLIAHPDIKMHYGVLLISETQGVGKSTLGEKILAPLVGMLNFSTPSEDDIVSGNFNYWMAHRRLAVVQEIYAGNSSKAYNKLKSIITDKNINVHKKYMADYSIENWLHVFACSNSPRALKMSMDDRRWLVPAVTSEKRDEGYWEKFHHWLNRQHGLGKILTWAKGFNDIVAPGSEAPWTSIKKTIIEESFSQGQSLVNETLETIREERPDERIIISDRDLVQLIVNVLYEGKHTDKLERPATVRAIAKGQGWFIGASKAKVKAWGTIMSRPTLICSHLDDAKRTAGELAEAGRKLFDVETFYRAHAKM